MKLWQKYQLHKHRLLLPFSFGILVISFLISLRGTGKYSLNREVKKLEFFLEKKYRDFNRLLKDTNLIRRVQAQNESIKEFEQLTRTSYGIYFYNINDHADNHLFFWNQQHIIPDQEILALPDGEYFKQLANGYYYIITKRILSDVKAVALVQVRSKYFIETEYLPEAFTYSKKSDKKVKLSSSHSGYPVKTPTGKILLYLENKNSADSTLPTIVVLLRIVALFFLLLFSYLEARFLSKKNYRLQAVALLFLSFFGVRLIMYAIPSFLNLNSYELFRPVWFGSDIIQRSPGDLLINTVFFTIFISFIHQQILYLPPKILFSEPYKIYILKALLILFYLATTFYISGIIRSLVSDSKISFDVTNFFSLNYLTVIGLFILALLSVSFFLLSEIILKWLLATFMAKTYLLYIAVSAVGLLYLTFQKNHVIVLFYLPVLLWLVVYTIIMTRQHRIFSFFRINNAGTIFRSFLFSASIAAVMLNEIQSAEWEKRKRMAEKIAVQTDPSGETLLSIGTKYLDDDFLSENFERFQDSLEGKKLRDSILTFSYSGYLNKYDTRIFVFDRRLNPVYNDEPLAFETLNTILQVQSKPTRIEGLYYFETDIDKFNYILRKEISDSARQVKGYVFLVFYPKYFSREAIFPELFKQYSQHLDPEHSPVYSVAVYKNDTLISPSGNYSFPSVLLNYEKPKHQFEERTKMGYSELWYLPSPDKVIIISRKKATWLEAVTLFSYLFCSFLFIQLCATILHHVFELRLQKKFLRSYFHLNIRSKIHYTVILISILLFIIIGAVTISFFINRFHKNNFDKLSRTLKIMVNVMEKKITEHKTFDDVLKLYDSVSFTQLHNLVDEVADIHGLDVNVYDLEGNLRVSSESNVYNKGVLSRKMNPVAYYHVHRLRETLFAQTEKIGSFEYLSMYAPVRDEHKKIYAYINIPYFTSRIELEQEISNFLVTIINLNAFIFLIAGLIAVGIANHITRSFSFISNKMKEIHLGGKNLPITWNRNDEIGELVKEYNKMVVKLNESVEKLAKSEREGAWREMARQVAHEIKNPLTPMKLSIQYLEKAIQQNQPHVKELSLQVARTLTEQIEHLSRIASEFSQFANLANIHPERFALHELIRSLFQLYRSHPGIEMQWFPVEHPVYLFADKTQMNRLLTNLLTNAVEACRGKEGCIIRIREELLDNHIRISISDNGEGIPEELQHKIFEPNFTTKSSGTGLGLAMCKGIVEKAGGTIRFETQKGVGTTFIIELPLA